jgi:hypothetical protein
MIGLNEFGRRKRGSAKAVAANTETNSATIRGRASERAGKVRKWEAHASVFPTFPFPVVPPHGGKDVPWKILPYNQCVVLSR